MLPESIARAIPIVIIKSFVVVADRLRERMDALGLSQAELARRVGVRQPTIFKLTSGGGYGSKHLHRIARELGTTPAYLTGETDNPDEDAPAAPELKHEERELVECARGMSAPNRAALMQLARALPKDELPAPASNREEVALPPERALARMYEAHLRSMKPGLPLAEQAQLLAQLLPSGLTQLKDLLPAAPTSANATQRSPQPNDVPAPQ